ncbi:MAG: hypothetical protein WBZ24_09295 [Anaerolineales bacterium]
MTLRNGLTHLGKLMLAAVGYELGVVLGGMLVTLLGLQAPNPPPGSDMAAVARYMMFTAPLYALALAILATQLGGGYIARWLSLASLLWIAYTVNTQLEAAIVSSYATGRAFAIVSGAVTALVGGAVVAWMFPGRSVDDSAWGSMKGFFARRTAGACIGRLVLAALVFMPIYFVFGLLVLPFTGTYYQEQLFGLAMPTMAQLLPTLFARSLLFLLVTLPILAMWRGTRMSLFWRLGLSLFMLVGFNIMLVATWLPVYVRFPHTLEILADEFVYAGALVWLLVPRRPVQS